MEFSFSYKDFLAYAPYASCASCACVCDVHPWRRRSVSRDRTNSTNKESKPSTNIKTPKKKPYIKIYATPDRPPPAAVMLVEVVVVGR